MNKMATFMIETWMVFQEQSDENHYLEVKWRAAL
jgi:hypothetical protein